jgi:hypothetical protein
MDIAQIIKHSFFQLGSVLQSAHFVELYKVPRCVHLINDEDE